MSDSEVYAAGRKAPASGLYRTGTGRQVALSKGERFPPSFSGWELVQAASGTATDLGLRSPAPAPGGNRSMVDSNASGVNWSAYANAEDLNWAEELDALLDAARALRAYAQDVRNINLPGTALHYEDMADRLERLRARLGGQRDGG